MKGFAKFISEQGALAIAMGIIIGGAVSKVVSALVADVINPLAGIFLKGTALQQVSLKVGSAWLLVGDLASVCLDALIVIIAAYCLYRLLGPVFVKTVEE